MLDLDALTWAALSERSALIRREGHGRGDLLRLSLPQGTLWLRLTAGQAQLVTATGGQWPETLPPDPDAWVSLTRPLPDAAALQHDEDYRACFLSGLPLAFDDHAQPYARHLHRPGLSHICPLPLEPLGQALRLTSRIYHGGHELRHVISFTTDQCRVMLDYALLARLLLTLDADEPGTFSGLGRGTFLQASRHGLHLNGTQASVTRDLPRLKAALASLEYALPLPHDAARRLGILEHDPPEHAESWAVGRLIPALDQPAGDCQLLAARLELADEWTLQVRNAEQLHERRGPPSELRPLVTRLLGLLAEETREQASRNVCPGKALSRFLPPHSHSPHPDQRELALRLTRSLSRTAQMNALPAQRGLPPPHTPTLIVTHSGGPEAECRVEAWTALSGWQLTWLRPEALSELLRELEHPPAKGEP